MKQQKKFILTANDLFMGDVVYYNKSGSWVRSLKQSQIFSDETEAQAALDAALEDANLVAPYLAEVDPENSVPTANHFREEFRATGPSNYFHGKQEQS